MKFWLKRCAVVRNPCGIFISGLGFTETKFQAVQEIEFRFVEYFSRSTVQTAKHKIGKQNDIFDFSNLLRGTAIYMNMKKYAVNWHLIGTHSN